MNLFNETIRMFFAVGALLLVGLLSTPNLDLDAGPTGSSIAESKQNMTEMLPKSVQSALEKEKIAFKKPKKKQAENKKLSKRIIALKKS